jgi:hypothetical protein
MMPTITSHVPRIVGLLGVCHLLPSGSQWSWNSTDLVKKSSLGKYRFHDLQRTLDMPARMAL